MGARGEDEPKSWSKDFHGAGRGMGGWLHNHGKSKLASKISYSFKFKTVVRLLCLIPSEGLVRWFYWHKKTAGKDRGVRWIWFLCRTYKWFYYDVMIKSYIAIISFHLISVLFLNFNFNHVFYYCQRCMGSDKEKFYGIMGPNLW